MKCPNCGAEVNFGSCEYCGSTLEQEVVQVMPQDQADTTPRTIPLRKAKSQGWIIAFILIALYGLFLYINSLQNNKKNVQKTLNTPRHDIYSSQTTSYASEQSEKSAQASYSSDQSTESVQVSSNASNQKTYGLNETASSGKLLYTATELKETTGKQYYLPADGNVFVGVNFTIENSSDKDETISFMIFNAYVDGIASPYSFSAIKSFSNNLLSGTVAPGKKIIGWYGVEVPKNWNELELQVKSSIFGTDKTIFIFHKNNL